MGRVLEATVAYLLLVIRESFPVRTEFGPPAFLRLLHFLSPLPFLHPHLKPLSPVSYVSISTTNPDAERFPYLGVILGFFTIGFLPFEGPATGSLVVSGEGVPAREDSVIDEFSSLARAGVRERTYGRVATGGAGLSSGVSGRERSVGGDGMRSSMSALNSEFVGGSPNILRARVAA
jgi:hypothetical protein